MGYLTTITFYNDSAQEMHEHPKEVSEMIYRAQQGAQLIRGSNTEPIGNSCNPVIIQKPRHADDHTIYVHMGNTVVEMSSYSSHTDNLMMNHQEFFEDLLKYMESQVKELKKNYKKVKDNK